MMPLLLAIGLSTAQTPTETRWDILVDREVARQATVAEAQQAASEAERWRLRRFGTVGMAGDGLAGESGASFILRPIAASDEVVAGASISMGVLRPEQSDALNTLSVSLRQLKEEGSQLGVGWSLPLTSSLGALHGIAAPSAEKIRREAHFVRSDFIAACAFLDELDYAATLPVETPKAIRQTLREKETYPGQHADFARDSKWVCSGLGSEDVEGGLYRQVATVGVWTKRLSDWMAGQSIGDPDVADAAEELLGYRTAAVSEEDVRKHVRRHWFSQPTVRLTTEVSADFDVFRWGHNPDPSQPLPTGKHRAQRIRGGMVAQGGSTDATLALKLEGVRNAKLETDPFETVVGAETTIRTIVGPLGAAPLHDDSHQWQLDDDGQLPPHWALGLTVAVEYNLSDARSEQPLNKTGITLFADLQVLTDVGVRLGIPYRYEWVEPEEGVVGDPGYQHVLPFSVATVLKL